MVVLTGYLSKKFLAFLKNTDWNGFGFVVSGIRTPTLLLAQGVSPKVASERLGHASLAGLQPGLLRSCHLQKIAKGVSALSLKPLGNSAMCHLLILDAEYNCAKCS